MTAIEFHGNTVLKPRHRFDIQEAAILKQQLAEIVQERHPLLVIDMTDVEFIDSSGLGVLVIGMKTARDSGCRLVICNLQATVRLLFEITQLDKVFEIFDSLEAIPSSPPALAIA